MITSNDMKVVVTSLSPDEIVECLNRAIAQFPDSFRQPELAHLPQYAFNVSLVFRKGDWLVDLGCGTGAFPLVCAMLGTRVTIVADPLFEQFPPLYGTLYLIAEKPVDHGHDV